MNARLDLKINCPKCKSKKEISAYETIEATTEFYFKDGTLEWTNNEYGNGIRMDFLCHCCGHRWVGRKGITINNYTEKKK